MRVLNFADQITIKYTIKYISKNENISISGHIIMYS